MGISALISKVCVQTAVYWGGPVSDGKGGHTFDAPVEIKCRWTDKQRVTTDQDGLQLQAKGNLMVTQDLDTEGWVYLGLLEDLTNEDNNFTIPANPINVPGAYKIIAVDKIPMVKSKTVFVRTIYFGFGNV